MTGLVPILGAAGVAGLVEPLGLAECSLRLKREVVEAINAVGAPERFKLVHGTLHPFVADERDLFPERAGLLHISGVKDPAVPRESMRDPHRVLVGPGDRIDNVGQIRALAAGGYRGAFSFEPFAAEVAASRDPEGDLRVSIDFVAAAFGRATA